MFSFIQSIFSSRRASTDDETLIQAAIERVVDGTDPRLRSLGGYKKKLHAAVACAVEYVVELVDTMPSAIEISPGNFTADPRLRAFFVSPDHLREIIGSSQGVRDYLQRPLGPQSDRVYCMLSLDRSEKNALGMELRNDVVMRDVAQVIVNFSNHRLVAVTGSESETRWEIKKRAFDHLIQSALQDILSARGRKRELEKQRALLRSKLKAMQAGQAGLEPLLEPTDQAPPDLAAIEEQMAAIETELLKLGADSMTLENHLQHIAATLSRPREHLHVERVSLTLDAMGVKRTENSGTRTSTLHLDEAVSGNRRRIVLPGYFARADIPPQRDFIDEASRYLSSR